jgi:hypothetical protein
VSQQRSPSAISDAFSVLRQIFTSPRLLAAMIFGVAVMYVLLCRQEMDMRTRDPEVWRLVYGTSTLSLRARCFLYCTGGVTAQVVPIFIVLYVKKWRQRARMQASASA